ncbi:caspase family protein [Archangium primigenium]|nr:caspase family protein [Archangium primigenium]MBM7115690.1 caspase family protein [Archangium primigenium]
MRCSDFSSVPPDFERGLAIVIGVNTYTHGIPPLFNAVRDAEAVAATLEGQGFEVMRLLDEAASLAALTELLTRDLPSLQPPPDRLLIYFAGHGLAHTDDEHRIAGFLLPADARREDPSSYWPMASLRQALRELPCRHLLLILDCCFAGAFPHSTSRDLRAPDAPAPLFLERFRHFSSRRSFQLLLSTAHDELASDRLLSKPSQESLGDGRHSPFALALLQALQFPSPADTNQDGLLTASELSTFLRDRLVELLPAYGQQTPALWPLDWHDSGEFLFLLAEAFPALPLAAPLSRRSNPYLGLRPFSSAHRHLFFGRERFVDALMEHLRARPLLVLCGPSGIGKSSTVHAALLPRLSDDPAWRVPPSLRPSTQPLAALAAWLASLRPGQPSPSAANLLTQPHAAAECVRAFLIHHGDLSLLLVVDPLEELVTTCPDDAQRQAFLRALSGLLQLAHPRLRLLWLLRSDFEPHFLSLMRPSGLSSEQWHANRRPLPPMNRDELRLCIEKPAEACVLFFEPGLVEHLLDDVEQMPGALPLLSVALSELFDGYLASGRSDRTLTFEDYRRIGGGIAGALQRRAELIFSGTPPLASAEQAPLPALRPGELPAFQHTLRNVLLRMVSLEGGELARRRVPRAELDYGHAEENERVRRVLSTLEGCRLIVASDDGGPCVEPAHDALLSAWPRLHDWARHSSRELLLLRRVSHAAAEWQRHRQSHDFLWADGRMAQLGLAPAALRRTDEPLALSTVSPEDRPDAALGFNAVESGFLRASARRRRVLRTRRSSMACTVVIALVLLTVLALLQARAASANAHKALEQQQLAETNAQEASQQREKAVQHAWESHLQQAVAQENAQDAKAQKKNAVSNYEEAQRQRRSAEHNAREALEKQRLAEANAQESRLQKQRAEENAREARRQREAAEHNAQEAAAQQRIAEANAQEALAQKSASEAYAQEAGRQQEMAEVNAKEAQRQQEAATANAKEARQQQEAAELNFQEAQAQQWLAMTNAQEAQRLREAAEANARRALEQQDLATTNAEEARRQARLVGINLQLSNAKVLLDKSPTQAMLVLREIKTVDGASDKEWLQSASQISQRLISNAIFSGHTSSVEGISYSPDGSHILTSSADGTARLWRADGEGEPRILTGHEDAVSFATFSPNGSRILTASYDGTARLWDAQKEHVPAIVLKGPDFNKNDPVPLTAATFSPDSALILIANAYGSVYLWRTSAPDQPPLRLGGHEDQVNVALFSTDGLRILTASNDGTARVWNLNGDILDRLDHKDEFNSDEAVNCATFSPDGKSVLTGSSSLSYPTTHSVRLWTLGVAEPRVFKGHSADVNSVAFSQDGHSFLTASSDNTARLWNSEGQDPPRVLSGHSNWVTSATFSPDGSFILTSSADGTARLWRTDGMEQPLILHGHTDWVSTARFSPDGSSILTASEDRTARLWRLRGAGTPFFSTPADSNMPPALSPNGSEILTAASDGTLHLFSLDGSGQRLESFSGHLGWTVNSATFNRDGSLALSASDDGTARLWQVGDTKHPPRVLQTNNEMTSALFSPDGALVLTLEDKNARLWHTYSPDTNPRRLKGHKDSINLATFSPDGKKLLTGSDDETVLLWNLEKNEAPRPLRGHTGTATSASFSPDGSLILVASNDGVAQLWRTSEPERAPRLFAGYTNVLNSAEFSPAGTSVVIAASEGIASVRPMYGTGPSLDLKGHKSAVASATFTPDGDHVLTVSDDGSARLWPMKSQSLPLVFQHEEKLEFTTALHALITPDGSRVITVCGEGLVRVWYLKPEPLREYFQTATTACLSSLEREQYLLEEPDIARKKYKECEESHGRTL